MNIFFHHYVILLSKENHNISVFMPYIDRLNKLHFGIDNYGPRVSERKKRYHCINALGTVDQHSQLQLFLDGPNDKFFTFIGKLKTTTY